MKTITPDSLLSDLTEQHPSLLPILYLTGICTNYEGKTLNQLCKEKAINESYLMNLVMALTDDRFEPSETFPSYGILQLTALSSALCPYFSQRFDASASDILKTIGNFKRGGQEKNSFGQPLKASLEEYGSLLSERWVEQEQVVIPHVSNVYELYYSPDYTSGHADLMSYSLDFYDGGISRLQHSFENLKALLEQILQFHPANLNFAAKVYGLFELHREVLLQEKMTQKLLKPLVLVMEESIINTFRKKNGTFRRSNYLSLPAGIPASDVLSPREKEVLQLVARGLMNKEIADHLNIGLTTVITHRKNIVEKLGIRTVPGLTVYAYTQGYLDEPNLPGED